MRARRVFVSHSAKSPAEVAVLERLRLALEQAGFAVLLDREELRLGEGWRHTLNLWIGGCNAAVVLLSEGALASPYVAYESAVLSYRRQFDPTFHLIPLLFAPVDRARVQASRLNPAVLSELQWVGELVAPDAGITAITARLADVVAQDTPVDRAAKLVAWLLEKTPEYVLDQEITRLGIDVGGWLPEQAKLTRLAYGLLGAGLERGHDSFMVLAGFVRDDSQEAVNDLIDVVGSSWVDCSTLDRIPGAWRSQQPVALSGYKTETARMYLVRACERRPSRLWRLATVDGVVGERTLDDLRVLVRSALCTTFGVSEEGLDKELEIEEQQKEKEPLFVALPSPSVDAETLRALRGEFRGVTFFLLTGHPPPRAQLSAATVLYLDPDIEQEAELYHVAQYKAKRRLLQKR